ncbi:30S ribosomal protein S16 [Candidatus Nomurabacteria bacterium]|nr:30S ribosomal protein S16 [Candidatus Nomurabacteria bacterium]
MLAIRMQRTGRKGYPTYRVIVQEAHRQPTSGKVVANIGNYNPHTKEVNVDKEKAEFYLKNGAQPSDRVVYVFESEKISLPEWVKKTSTKKQKTIKNLEKLRRNQPEEEVVAEEAPAETEEEAQTETVVDEAPAEDAVEETTEDNAPDAEAKSVEEIAKAEVADGQVTAEEEVASDAEAADPTDTAEDQAEKPA